MKSEHQLSGVRAHVLTPHFSVLFPYRQEKSTWRLRQVLVPSTEFGRRDWTRTNDPHHVKVVL
jgi:hypothetical protein